jgi:hypothetical protein
LFPLTLLLVVACTGGSTSTSSQPLKGGTLRVGMTTPDYSAMDPQQWDGWELFRCCLLRTLMSYDGSDGPTGTQPQPDLASGPPEVSVDGLTWTFHLRPDVHHARRCKMFRSHRRLVRALLRTGRMQGPVICLCRWVQRVRQRTRHHHRHEA